MLNRNLGEAVAGEGAKLVVADNLYMYGPIAGPISEALSAAGLGASPSRRYRSEAP